MRIISLFLCLSIPLLIGAQTQKAELLHKNELSKTSAFLSIAKPISIDIVNSFKENNYQVVSKYFNSDLKTKLDANRLEQTWKSIESNYGLFLSIKSSEVKVTAEAIFLLTEIEFKNQNLDLEISLDENNEVRSFMLLPAKDKRIWLAPSYGNWDELVEIDTVVGDKNALLAKWTQPLTNNKEFIVVFVHGSGPNDMDGSLGPNKIFKDLAYGLANNGISSLRYNKRTYDYRSDLATKQNELTIDMEVVDDAKDALHLAKGLGYTKVILIGHSLGGHMAPKIAKDETINGVITLAGNSSPLVNLIVPQFEYLLANDPSSQITSFMVDAMKSQVKKVNDKNYDENTNAYQLPLNLSGVYWKSLEGYYPAKVSKKQKVPYLILNGSRDYQVTIQEANNWKNGNKHKLSKTIIYKDLNHMFFEGKGVLLPKEYDTINHVEPQVLIDISNWIKAL